MATVCNAEAAYSYSTILDPNDVVTGVRGVDSSNVLLTGTYQGSPTQAFLYEGPIAGGGTTYLPTPGFANVTGSTFYGPDTHLFTPSIAVGNIRAVGSYQTSDTGIQDHGMLYEGPISGGGTWTNIDVPTNVAGGTVEETIAHSTMGNLVVGDYDLANVANSANAFIYNISTSTFTAMNIGGLSNDTTAYGIWQNGIGSNSYTIAGGTQDGLDINKAYLVNYNSLTGVFTNLTYYTYGDSTGTVTHFEGITGTANGYNLIATTDTGAAMASVVLREDGTYSDATWLPISYPGNTTDTGNSVYENVGMGIYTTTGVPGAQSYIVVVPEPSTTAIFALSLLALGWAYSRRRAHS